MSDQLSDEELGTLVATRVMGWHMNPYLDEWLDASGILQYCPSGYFAPAISHDDMLTVVLKVLEDEYVVSFWKTDKETHVVTTLSANTAQFHESSASTLPRAMCMVLVNAYEVAP